MNCTVIQRRLLSAEQPDQPPAEIRRHLAQCPACRACQRRLLQLERQIPQLPVPPSTAKGELLQRLLGPVPSHAVGGPIAEPQPWRYALVPGPKERGLRKLSVAFALAASLLIFALAWWSWPHERASSARNEVARIEHQERLEQRLRQVLRAEKPQERVLQIAVLAEEVQEEARGMVNSADKLDQWADFCERLVSKDLLDQARQLPSEERLAVLDRVSKSLINMESRASHLAVELERSAPKSAASFGRIALAARKSERDLRVLLHG